ncbi:MAG TPA: VOC family protein [Phenylobacterium sp.]|uniref:VOC family protein n=1 Tax=Phenylobacterium sp. TaxID=1871053 RepID=UPI002D4B63C6|nr:VOC family protein [Phenylobacterium sp.]HZZ69695.1 VOC family protein [Phenylobacterium sp.]
MADVPTFQPSVFYRDPMAALRWLEACFGFETTSLVVEPSGRVGHSEMSFLSGAVNINPEFSSEIIGDARMVSPLETEGRCTQFIRVHLAEGLDAHCERARAAGARITQEPGDQFYGERTYRVLDLEGHVWNFAQPIANPPSIEEMERASGLKITTFLPPKDA